MASSTIIGFDSAWTDNPKAPGAICAIKVDGRERRLVGPQLASFDDALRFIRDARTANDLCLVSLDQPTIVPNRGGSRPVDRVASTLISWLGGGVQPANRSKVGMFDDAAPVWSFIERLGATQEPERVRTARCGLFLIEVFPAIMLPTLEAEYFGRNRAAKYNPARRKTFKLEHWQGVLAAVSRFAQQERIEDLCSWVVETTHIGRPRKADQDRLDAILCVIAGLVWVTKPRGDSIMIGDLASGYMITPASADVRARLSAAATGQGVNVDGSRPTGANAFPPARRPLMKRRPSD